MTEDQARTTLCHRTLTAVFHGHDHSPRPVRGGLCVASECQAWQYSYRGGDDGGCGLSANGHPYLYPRGTVAPPTEPTPS